MRVRLLNASRIRGRNDIRRSIAQRTASSLRRIHQPLLSSATLLRAFSSLSAPYSPSYPRPLSTQQIWRNKTQRLVEQPPGTWTDAEWHEFSVAYVQYWTSQSSREGVAQVFKLLNRVYQELERSNEGRSSQQILLNGQQEAADYLNRAIAVWKRTPESKLTTRQIERKLQQYTQNGIFTADCRTYTLILQGCLERRHQDHALSPEKTAYLAEKFLFTLQNELKIQPDAMFLLTVMDCWSKSGLKEAPEKVQYLLETMHTHHQPETRHYNILLNAYSKSHKPEQALQLLQSMESLQINVSIQPDVQSYSTVVAAFAAAGQPEKAEKVLRRLLNKSQKKESLIPDDPAIFGSLVHAWSKIGEPERAETVLNWQKKFAEDTGRPQLMPSVIVYNSVLNGWAKCSERRPDAPERAEEMLQRMISDDSIARPDMISFTSVVECWGRSGDPERAEAVLSRMIDLSEQTGDADLLPDKIAFTAVLHAWSRSNNPLAPERAEVIVREMQRLHDMGFPNVQPNTVSFTVALDCLARSSLEDSAERAEALFDWMCELHREGGREAKKLAPNTFTYNTVLKAWSRSKRHDAPERAEEILRRMQRDGVSPSKYSFSTLMLTWTRSGRKDAAEKAERLIEEMKHLAENENGDKELKPGTFVYNTLIDAYAKVGDVTKAVQVLLYMKDEYGKGDVSVKPDLVSYNCVLQALAKSRDNDAASKTELLIQEILELHQKGDSDMTANANTFTSAISAVAQLRTPESGLRAEEYLNLMKQLYEGGIKQCKPSFITYSAVINAWTNSGHPDAAERAFALLNEMRQSNDPDIKPNAVCCSSIIRLYSQRGDPEMAEETLKYMNEEYENGNMRIKPDTVTYTTVLQAWARSKHANAIASAESILRRMQSEDATARPNAVTYITLLSGIARSRLPNKGLLAEKYLRQMQDLYKTGQKNCKPETVAYSLVINAWVTSQHEEAIDRAMSLLEEMKASGDQDVSPNVRTYDTVIKALMNSKCTDKDAKIRQLQSESEEIRAEAR